MSRISNALREFITRRHMRESISSAAGRISTQLVEINGQLRRIAVQLGDVSALPEAGPVGTVVDSVDPTGPAGGVRSKRYSIGGILLAVPEDIVSEKFHSDLVSGTYESRELAPIRKKLRGDDVVLELGTAVGFVSTYVAKLLDRGRVISYEANPAMLPIAANNHRLNGVKVELHHALVTPSGDGGSKPFYVDRTFFWDSGIVPRAHENGSLRERILVASKAFPEIIDEVDPTVIIIDIEGAEAGLFEHVESLEGVRHIFMELHAFIGPFEIHRLFRKLSELGLEYDPTQSADYVAVFSRNN